MYWQSQSITFPRIGVETNTSPPTYPICAPINPKLDPKCPSKPQPPCYTLSCQKTLSLSLSSQPLPLRGTNGPRAGKNLKVSLEPTGRCEARRAGLSVGPLCDDGLSPLQRQPLFDESSSLSPAIDLSLSGYIYTVFSLEERESSGAVG